MYSSVKTMQLYSIFHGLSNDVVFIDSIRSQELASVDTEISVSLFSSKLFCHNQNKSPTVIYQSIENFIGFKVMQNSRCK